VGCVGFSSRSSRAYLWFFAVKRSCVYRRRAFNRKARQGFAKVAKKAPCDVASSSECLWRVVLLCDLRALIFAFFAVKGFCLSTDEELLTAKVAKDRKARGENPLGSHFGYDQVLSCTSI